MTVRRSKHNRPQVYAHMPKQLYGDLKWDTVIMVPSFTTEGRDYAISLHKEEGDAKAYLRCSCPAWPANNPNPFFRTCKHLASVFGAEEERERVARLSGMGWPVPPPRPKPLEVDDICSGLRVLKAAIELYENLTYSDEKIGDCAEVLERGELNTRTISMCRRRCSKSGDWLGYAIMQKIDTLSVSEREELKEWL